MPLKVCLCQEFISTLAHKLTRPQLPELAQAYSRNPREPVADGGSTLKDFVLRPAADWLFQTYCWCVMAQVPCLLCTA